MARGSVFGLTRFALTGLTIIALSATCMAQQPAAARGVVHAASTAPLGQAPAKPTVIVVIKNGTEFLDDIKLLFTLANAEAQFKTLNANMFELFLTGVDRSQPLVISGSPSKKPGNNEVELTISVPIGTPANFTKYRNAIKDLDLRTKSAQSDGSYAIKTKTYTGFLRHSTKMKYAHLSPNQADVRQDLFSFDPNAILGNDDMVFLIDNSKQKPETRKQDFERIRKETLNALKPKQGEAPADFNLRKNAFELQFNELERFFVESEKIRISLNTDAKAKQTNIQLELKALPGTPLADSIEMVTKVNAFYSETTLPGAAVQLFLNFPIDAMRKKHIQDYVKLARPRAKQRILESKGRTDAQRQTDADIADLMLDVLEGFGGLDSLNGFLQMVPTEKGKYAVAGSGRLADGKKFADGIKKLKEREVSATLDIETIGKDKDIAIHSLKLPNKAAKYPQVFGADQTIYIATSPKSMWYASGDNALKTLKSLIEQSEKAGSKPVNTLAKLDARLLPFIEILDAQIKANPPASPPLPPAAPPKGAPRRPKPEGELRRMALETFAAGKDVLHASLTRESPLTIKIQLTAEEGILTFFGKAAAKFVKENLE